MNLKKGIKEGNWICMAQLQSLQQKYRVAGRMEQNENIQYPKTLQISACRITEYIKHINCRKLKYMCVYP